LLSPKQFQKQVLVWFDRHGRKDLPWQKDINPYRVWVSEIMLQQTQVATVIPYYQRFMAALPSVEALASASEDQVLHLWTGLGYYARGRNLLRCAQLVCSEHQGQFPDTVAALQELPGIGRSTAGAICSIAFGKPAAILDGNVKRVLARYGVIPGWPGKSQVLSSLWELAESFNPDSRTADYSQAMMDLGATVCLRTQPNCDACPLGQSCQANSLQQQQHFPGKKPRKVLPVKSTTMLIITNRAGEIFMARRPTQGIWGGLWSFPEVADHQAANDFCIDQFGQQPANTEHWETLRHSFSHYHLEIQPLHIQLSQTPATIMEGDTCLWYNREQPDSVGMAAPVAKLLKLIDKV
jgi:A/G-specific adenine glycosylase